MKNKEQRVAVLVDVANMYHSAKNLYRSRVNYQEVLKVAVGERKLVRACAYVIQSYSSEEKGFFEVLAKQGFIIRVKDLQIFPGGMKKGDWDVGLTIDAVKLCARVDVIVLVTGDGDYEPLVEYLQNQGVQVEVVAFAKSASQRLVERADYFFDISELSKRYLIQIKK
jgi:uncharacterized protein (TIGR00288 family)